MAKRKTKAPSRRLFRESDQTGMFEKSVEEEVKEQRAVKVECLGMTFENDDARREHFLKKLAEKLKDPEFRKIEGFPIGTDEDILALSDPPYYTACPNPFLADYIKHYGRAFDQNEHYSRKPFAVDVSEGKTDPIYRAHAYHTKVPYLAIVPSILHYTGPGDVVLDGFCGSGMTGVAAQWCGVAPKEYRQELEMRWEQDGMDKPAWGARRVILSDLAPAATFIAAHYGLPFDVRAFSQAGKKLLEDVEKEIGWMYETLHTDGKTKGRIEYTVWSEVFTCPECSGEIVFTEEAFDAAAAEIRDIFACPRCKAQLNKRQLEVFYESHFDTAIGATVRVPRRIPVLIKYRVGDNTYHKSPDKADKDTLRRIDAMPLPSEVPTLKLPDMQMVRVGRMQPAAIRHIHQFFLPRARHALGLLWKLATNVEDPRLRSTLIFFVEQAIWTSALLNRYRPSGFSQVNQYLTGVFYIPSQHAEVSPWYVLAGKLLRLGKAFHDYVPRLGMSITSTGDCARLPLQGDSVDYVFTDPPFGENIYYADLNVLVEAWYKLLTNPVPEAIVDRVRGKALPDYQHLMENCFGEYYRVLKPGRWMTVVFHNSKSSVWNSIQEALQRVGFVIADVRTLDKQQASFQQVTSPTAVKQDLVISAYKPNGGLEGRFKLEAGTPEGVWDFARTHLKQLPVFVAKGEEAEVIAERQNYLLYDRMVAFHVQRGVMVPLSASEFYEGLTQRFSNRDGMFFLSEQAAEYDRRRMSVKEVRQLTLFVKDESSAILWLQRLLKEKPQTFQDVHPQFMREIGGWEQFEKPLELKELLEENFLCCDGQGEVPSQIHTYLSSNFHDLRNLECDAPALRAKAKDRWFVPDTKKAGDLEQLRERALLKEFWDYLPSGYQPAGTESPQTHIPGLEPRSEPIPKGRRLKVIRLEAVRAGFKHCWQNRDYRTIIAVAQRIPENVLQEDPKLLMWYDQALTRTGVEQ